MLFGAGEQLKEDDVEKPLGFIAHKYESGNAGPGVIADVPGDGGGKAYGIYQLDSAYRHLRLYINQSPYAPMFKRIPIASPAFDAVWQKVTDMYPREFEANQREYVTSKYYRVAAHYAKKYGFDVTSRAVQEAVFSIALQHGSWRIILKRARRLMSLDSAETQILALYTARRFYVQGLRSLTASVKASLMTRYSLEEKDVLSLLEGGMISELSHTTDPDASSAD